MIAQSHRFHGHAALRHVYGRGLAVRGSGLTLRYLQNPRQSAYRSAVVVSKKVHKSAVVRNRIRRRLYEIIRLQEESMTQPHDFVFSVFAADLATLPADRLESMVVGMLRRAGIVQSTLPQSDSARGLDPSHAIVEPKERQ